MKPYLLTGVVSVLDPLDYERAHNYQLTVQATDGGEPPLSNHATVNVTITDINDNAPIFLQNSYSAIVNEAALNRERLIQVWRLGLKCFSKFGNLIYILKRKVRIGELRPLCPVILLRMKWMKKERNKNYDTSLLHVHIFIDEA